LWKKIVGREISIIILVFCEKICSLSPSPVTNPGYAPVSKVANLVWRHNNVQASKGRFI